MSSTLKFFVRKYLQKGMAKIENCLKLTKGKLEQRAEYVQS